MDQPGTSPPTPPANAPRGRRSGAAPRRFPVAVLRAVLAAVFGFLRLLRDGVAELIRLLGLAGRWVAGIAVATYALVRSLPGRVRALPGRRRQERLARAHVAAFGQPHGPSPDRSLRTRLARARDRTGSVLTVGWRAVLSLCSVGMMAGAVLHAKGNQPLSAQVVLISFTLAVAMVPIGLVTEALTPREEKL